MKYNVKDFEFIYSFHGGFDSSVTDESEKRATLALQETIEQCSVSYMTADDLRYIADKLDEHEYYHYTHYIQDESDD